MSTTYQHKRMINNIRNETRNLLNSLEELTNLREEWDSTGMINTLASQHFIEENEGLAPEDITAVFTSLAAIKALMATGHATNLYKVK